MNLYLAIMSKKPSKTVIDAWVRLMRAQQTVLSHIERSLKAAGMPSLAWYDVLLELDRAGDGGMRPFELERELLLPQYGLSRLLDRIENAGYIERRPHAEDGRGQIVQITKKGADVRRRMWPVYAKAIDRAIATHLTEDEAAVLADLLQRLRGAPKG